MQTTTAAAKIEATISDYLSQRFPILGKIDTDTSLLNSGAIDSLGILELMMFMSESFGITLEDEDLDPDNLETPKKLAEFIARKRTV